MAITVAQLVADNNSSGNAEVHQNTIALDVFSGDDVIVAIAQSSSFGISNASVTDSKGHSYVRDQDSTISGTMRCGIWSTRATSALGAGVDWIKFTVSNSNTSPVSMYAMKVSGMAHYPDGDVGATTTGTSVNPNSGTTAATAQNEEIAIVQHAYAGTPAYTPPTGYSQTAATQVFIATTLTQSVAYKILSVIGVQQGVGILDASQDWGGLIVVYKAIVTVPASTAGVPSHLGVGTVGSGIMRG